MGFHRLTVPTYQGGLPSDYDYINNAVVPPGSSAAPAAVDAPKGGGPNAGTYLVAFAEDGRSPAVNRGVAAVAENTDILDDVIHQDIASPVLTNLVTAPSSGTTYDLTLVGAGIWLGDDPTAPPGDLFQLVDENGNELYDPTYNDSSVPRHGKTIYVSDILDPSGQLGGDIQGSGFSTGSVRLIFSGSVPNGKQYRVRYFRRSNLTDLTPTTFASERNWARVLSIDTVPFGTNAISLNQQVRDAFRILNGNERVRSAGGNTTFQYDVGDPAARDTTLIINPTTVSQTLGLPAAADAMGLRFLAVNTDGHLASFPMNVVSGGDNAPVNGSQTDANQGFPVLSTPFGAWLFVSDGTGWHMRALGSYESQFRKVAGDVVLYATDGRLVSRPTADGTDTTLTLPNPAQYTGRILDIWLAGTRGKTDFVPYGSEQIQGLSGPYEVTVTNARFQFLSDGTDWLLQ